MKKRIIEVPDIYEFRSALILHNLDLDLSDAAMRIAGEFPGLNGTDEGRVIRKIHELRRDLSKQFAEVWQRAHGGSDPAA